MRLRSIMVAAAVVTAVALSTAAPALADEAPPPGTATVDQVTPVVIDQQHPGTVRASFGYICEVTTETEHPCVGVKQNPYINTTTRSRSESSRAFYRTNSSSDKGPNALTCD